MIIKEFGEYIKGSEFEGHTYFVGGCVRDYYMGNPANDIDVVVDLLDGGMRLAMFLESKGLVTDLHEYPVYGVAAFRLKSTVIPEGIPIEAVHTRKEIYNHINRNPVTQYGTIQEDAVRRDLRINALYHNVSTGEITAPIPGSFDDFDTKVLETCDEPVKTFEDDPLRIFRVIRFACKDSLVGFSISENILRAFRENNFDIQMLAWERIISELGKIAASGHINKAFTYLRYVIKDTKKFDQLFIDALASGKLSPAIPIGATIGDMLPVFWLWGNKGKISVQDFGGILRDMHLPLDEIKKALGICEAYTVFNKSVTPCQLKQHYLHSDVKKLLRKFFYKHKTADYVRMAFIYCGWQPGAIQKLFDEVNPDFWTSYKLPVTGEDVMRIALVKPGPVVKQLLDKCLDLVFTDPDLNNNTLRMEQYLEGRSWELNGSVL